PSPQPKAHLAAGASGALGPDGAVVPRIEPQTGPSGFLQNWISPKRSASLAAALALIGIHSADLSLENRTNPFPSKEPRHPPEQSTLQANEPTAGPQGPYETTVATRGGAGPQPPPAKATEKVAKKGLPPMKGSGIAAGVGNRFSRILPRMTAASLFVRHIFPTRPPPPMTPVSDVPPPPIPFCQHRPQPGQSSDPNLPFCEDIPQHGDATGSNNANNPANPNSGGDGNSPGSDAGTGITSSGGGDCSSGSAGAGGASGGDDGGGDGDGGGGGGD